MSVNTIAAEILSAAAEIGGETWDKIKKSAPIFVGAYAQALVDIAAGVAVGGKEGFSRSEGRMYEQNARLLLVMGLANTNHILLVQAQKLIDVALKIARTAINDAIGIILI